MKKFILSSFIVLAIFSCSKKDEVKPIVDYVQEKSAKQTLVNGTVLLTENFDAHYTDWVTFNNNFWGFWKSGAAKSQTMWVYSQDAWGVDLSATPHTGGNGDVKSYPSVILGYHYGSQTPKGNFPAKVSSVGKLSTSWSYKIHSGDELNASFDIWFNDVNYQRKDNNGNFIPAKYELMVWPYRKNQNPISFQYNASGAVSIGSFTTGGIKYNVYKGANYNSDGSVQTTVLTMIPSSNTTNTSHTFSANAGDLVREATKSKYGFINSNLYLLSVQAGYEICKGAKVETTNFDFYYN